MQAHFVNLLRRLYSSGPAALPPPSRSPGPDSGTGTAPQGLNYPYDSSSSSGNADEPAATPANSKKSISLPRSGTPASPSPAGPSTASYFGRRPGRHASSAPSTANSSSSSLASFLPFRSSAPISSAVSDRQEAATKKVSTPPLSCCSKEVAEDPFARVVPSPIPSTRRPRLSPLSTRKQSRHRGKGSSSNSISSPSSPSKLGRSYTSPAYLASLTDPSHGSSSGSHDAALGYAGLSSPSSYSSISSSFSSASTSAGSSQSASSEISDASTITYTTLDTPSSSPNFSTSFASSSRGPSSPPLNCTAYGSPCSPPERQQITGFPAHHAQTTRVSPGKPGRNSGDKSRSGVTSPKFWIHEDPFVAVPSSGFAHTQQQAQQQANLTAPSSSPSTRHCSFSPPPFSQLLPLAETESEDSTAATRFSPSEGKELRQAHALSRFIEHDLDNCHDCVPQITAPDTNALSTISAAVDETGKADFLPPLPSFDPTFAALGSGLPTPPASPRAHLARAYTAPSIPQYRPGSVYDVCSPAAWTHTASPPSAPAIPDHQNDERASLDAVPGWFSRKGKGSSSRQTFKPADTQASAHDPLRASIDHCIPSAFSGSREDDLAASSYPYFRKNKSMLALSTVCETPLVSVPASDNYMHQESLFVSAPEYAQPRKLAAPEQEKDEERNHWQQRAAAGIERREQRIGLISRTRSGWFRQT